MGELMKAAQLQSYGDVSQFVIADMPVPAPAAGEVLIRIEVSAVNPFDLILRQGLMAQLIALPLPAVLGGCAAGTVAALGADVSGLAVGERVVADFPPNGRGSNAEYGVVAASSVVPLPANLSFEQGAALVKAGLTGRQAVDTLRAKAGDRVLISGGLGSVGRAAIQYLQQIGAHPVAGVRPTRIEEARSLAGEAVDITQPPERPDFDLAISAAAPVATQLIGRVRDGGTVVSIVPVPEGANAGQSLTIHQIRHRTDGAVLAAALDSASRGVLVIPVAQTYPLEQIAAAHRAVAAGAGGKVVLHH